MKAIIRMVAALAAITGCSALALAQVPAVSPGAMPPAVMHQASPARMACRAQIDAQSLTGEQRKSAMHACMMPHVDACRQQAAQRGLAKGPDLKAFMHACMQSA